MATLKIIVSVIYGKPRIAKINRIVPENVALSQVLRELYGCPRVANGKQKYFTAENNTISDFAARQRLRTKLIEQRPLNTSENLLVFSS